MDLRHIVPCSLWTLWSTIPTESGGACVTFVSKEITLQGWEAHSSCLWPEKPEWSLNGNFNIKHVQHLGQISWMICGNDWNKFLHFHINFILMFINVHSFLFKFISLNIFSFLLTFIWLNIILIQYFSQILFYSIFVRDDLLYSIFDTDDLIIE